MGFSSGNTTQRQQWDQRQGSKGCIRDILASS